MDDDTPTMPKRVARLARQGGLPIPYMVHRTPQGHADFRVIDHYTVRRCLDQHRCAICGGEMAPPYVFIGGTRSIFEAHLFHDPAMHEDCARYAARTCPFLAKGRDYRDSNLPAPRTMGSVAPRSLEYLGWTRTYTLRLDASGNFMAVAGAWERIERIGRHGAPHAVIAPEEDARARKVDVDK